MADCAVSPHDLATLGVRIDRARTFAPLLDDAMHEFQINTPARKAAFLAQILHESGLCRWLVELWGPTPAQRRYEMRRDLGNVAPGDGLRFLGRGLIQLTGRANYKRAAEALGADLIAHPELLGEPTLACRSAGWFWQSHGCNELADAGDFAKLTKRINGGLVGYADRLALWEKAKNVLSA
jgi:putative chitinase